MEILLTETHDGGDFRLIDTFDQENSYVDLELDGGLYSAVYLSHFGGNVEASTTGNEKPGELRLDWFGNELVKNEPERQMNSGLERALNELEITSGNLLRISDFSEDDIDWIRRKGIAVSIISEAFITGVDRIEVRDTIEQPTNDTSFNFSWEYEKQRTLSE